MQMDGLSEETGRKITKGLNGLFTGTRPQKNLIKLTKQPISIPDVFFAARSLHFASLRRNSFPFLLGNLSNRKNSTVIRESIASYLRLMAKKRLIFLRLQGAAKAAYCNAMLGVG